MPPLSPIIFVPLPRHVQRWISREESGRDQLESDVCHRHHRPFLWPRYMSDSHGVPEHHIVILDWPVLGHPARQAVAPGALVGIVPGRVALGRGVACNPQMMVYEASALSHLGFRGNVGYGIGARY